VAPPPPPLLVERRCYYVFGGKLRLRRRKDSVSSGVLRSKYSGRAPRSGSLGCSDAVFVVAAAAADTSGLLHQSSDRPAESFISTLHHTLTRFDSCRTRPTAQNTASIYLRMNWTCPIVSASKFVRSWRSSIFVQSRNAWARRGSLSRHSALFF